MLSSRHIAKSRVQNSVKKLRYCYWFFRNRTQVKQKVHSIIPVRSVISASLPPFNVVYIKSTGADSEDQSAEWPKRLRYSSNSVLRGFWSMHIRGSTNFLLSCYIYIYRPTYSVSPTTRHRNVATKQSRISLRIPQWIVNGQSVNRHIQTGHGALCST